MGIRFSKVDSTREMTMLEFLKKKKKKKILCESAFHIVVPVALVLRVIRLSANFQCSRKKRIKRLP
jgi:hypothetical protein